MDRTIKLWLNVLLFVFLVLLLSFVIAYNTDNSVVILALASMLITSVSIRYLIFYESKKYYYWGLASILIDAVIVYFISGIDKYSIVKIFYLVLIGDAIIFYSILVSIVITFFCYLIFLVLSYISSTTTGLKGFLPNFLTSSLAVIFIIVIMSILKYVINQHTRLKETIEELESAHTQLKENSIQLKELAVIKERNRIAGEVHDTVGHTLTTVLIEIEAGKRIMKKDPEKAMYKLELAQEQVRNGLKDIIKSIKAISSGVVLSEDLKTSMERIIKETEIHTGVKVNYVITEKQSIPKKIQEVLNRALKEGLTNGIRHGKCSKFTFTLKIVDDFVEFILEDNGLGCNNLEYGFGLMTMKERVESVGGIIELASEKSEGFRLKIGVAYRKDQIYE